MSTTQQGVLIVLALFVAYGVVGRMDYEDALRSAQARADNAVRLLCWRSPAGPVHGEAPGGAARIVRAIHRQQTSEAPPLAEARELRCRILED